MQIKNITELILFMLFFWRFLNEEWIIHESNILLLKKMSFKDYILRVLNIEDSGGTTYYSTVIAQYEDHLLLNKKKLDMKSSNFIFFFWKDLRIVKNQRLLIAWYNKHVDNSQYLVLFIMNQTLHM